MIISVTALFISLGGVGYAAVAPNSRVGTVQLRNGAVTTSKLGNNSVSFRKIQFGAVGARRANTNQLQVRVAETCGAGTAIGSINTLGQVTCNPALPSEFAATGTAAVTSTASTVANVTLPGSGTYMAFANPTATVTSAGATGGTTEVTCSLTVGGSTQTRSATVDTVPPSSTKTDASIPLQLAGPAGPANVSCQSSSTPSTSSSAVSVTSAINALQTSSNN